MSRNEQEQAPAALSWRERAALVRSGAHHLAEAPAEVGVTLMRGMFDTLLRTSFEAVVLCDRVSGEYLEVSDSFCRLSGYSRTELLGRNAVELGIIDPDSVRRVAAADAVIGHEGMYENTITRRDGEQVVIEFTHSFLQNEYALVVARDVTARIEREAALHRLARVDELTGVLNRRGFRTDLDATLIAARTKATDVHLLVVDADGLKQINDDLGHEYGDELLVTTAAMLRAATSPHGVVGRLGGDEFVAFLTVGTRADAEAAANRMVSALSRRRIGPVDDARQASASVGVASGSETDYDANSLLALADARMYAAKAARRI